MVTYTTVVAVFAAWLVLLGFVPNNFLAVPNNDFLIPVLDISCK